MKERTTIVVMQPREKLWEALCDRTCDIVPFLDNIESAQLQSKEVTAAGHVRCVHVWRARVDMPTILAPHLNADLLEWTGCTEWRIEEFESRWVVKPHFMKQSVLCEALMKFTPAVAGRGTRIGIELEINGLGEIGGFQTIANPVITTYFRKLADAASRLIEES